MILFSCNPIVEYRRGLEVSREQRRTTNMCRSNAEERFVRENLIGTAALQRAAPRAAASAPSPSTTSTLDNFMRSG